MNSIFLKKYNESKGDIEEINTIAFGDTDVTKKKMIRESRISNIIYEMMSHMICQLDKERIYLKK